MLQILPRQAKTPLPHPLFSTIQCISFDCGSLSLPVCPWKDFMATEPHGHRPSMKTFPSPRVPPNPAKDHGVQMIRTCLSLEGRAKKNSLGLTALTREGGKWCRAGSLAQSLPLSAPICLLVEQAYPSHSQVPGLLPVRKTRVRGRTPFHPPHGSQNKPWGRRDQTAWSHRTFTCPQLPPQLH